MEKPVNGGLPYRSWDRMGRDLLLSFIAVMVGTGLTLLVSMGEKLQELSVTQAEIRRDIVHTQSRLSRHIAIPAHEEALNETNNLKRRLDVLEDRQNR